MCQRLGSILWPGYHIYGAFCSRIHIQTWRSWSTHCDQLSAQGYSY
ncbi:unnamed protein product [Nippostrongylus brasiliensis]|uniref:Uncharacterized protein n=1 Tax=Nippostrongylus brasiliensis TaxID=27835 RepID=A0A0N4XSK0_NIPBR|nr:unnamed protein product [Nippostrongylus brasiliensis]